MIKSKSLKHLLMLHRYKNYNFLPMLCQERLKGVGEVDKVLEVFTIFGKLRKNG